MHRYFVTGTDTDVGKTRVTATLARALRVAGEPVTVVKLVQTGLRAGVPGDAARAGRLAEVRSLEFARFALAGDPWSAARAEDAREVGAAELAEMLASIPGAIVAEGAGGLMVPLNPLEHFGHVAKRAQLTAVIAVGLRLGCLNHALLTHSACEQFGIPVAGAVLVERWGPAERAYRDDVSRALQGKLRILGILPFAEDEPLAVSDGVTIFDSLVQAT